jgi:hypothetical protein
MKIRLVVTEFFYADGRADETKLTAAFRSFLHSSKMQYYLLYLFSTLWNWHKALYSIYISTNGKGM